MARPRLKGNARRARVSEPPYPVGSRRYWGLVLFPEYAQVEGILTALGCLRRWTLQRRSVERLNLAEVVHNGAKRDASQALIDVYKLPFGHSGNQCPVRSAILSVVSSSS